jgi:hypothetical protein
MDGDKSEFKLSESEIDLAESGGQSSGSHLDPSIPLRVIYSPSVSREPSIGRRPSIGSHTNPSTTSNIETDPATLPPQTITDEEAPRQLQLPPTRSRRSSTVSNPASQYPRQNRLLKSFSKLLCRARDAGLCGISRKEMVSVNCAREGRPCYYDLCCSGESDLHVS